MRFAEPALLFLLLLLPVFAGLFLYAWRARRKALEQFVSWDLLPLIAGDIGRRRLVRGWIFFLLFYAAAVIAIARPQFGTKTEMAQSAGVDIMVALDVSRSMLAADIAPSRLERAKHEIGRFIDLCRGDRVGLVIFAGEAFLQCPLTLDYAAARMFLEPVKTDWVDVQGTVLGAAIDRCTEAFAKGPKHERIIVLISDGEDQQGDLDGALKRARDAGVRIYTVGVGSPSGTPIALNSPGGNVSYMKDRAGNVVMTRLDAAVLAKIAQSTGGTFFLAGTNLDLALIRAELDKMQKQSFGMKKLAIYEEQYQIMLALALIFLVLEFIFAGPLRAQKET